MNAPIPIRAKLITAALSLSVVCAFSTLHHIGDRSSAETAFRIACAVFAVGLAFLGVFGSAQLQLLWGWGLAAAAPFLLGLCIVVCRGSDLFFGSVATLAALVGGYLLLADTGVRAYRDGMKGRHVA